MGRRIDVPNLDDLMQRYQTGTNVSTLVRETGLSTQWFKKRIRDRGITRSAKGWESNATPRSTMSPSIRDIAWASGFLEGEGAFYCEKSGCERIQARQVEEEPLRVVQSIFGGSMQLRKNNRRGFGVDTVQPINEWRTSGSRARGIMMTVYPFMGSRRKAQIRMALGRSIERMG